MADGLNKVMLIGNLGADPDLRQTQGGESVLNMRLATANSYLDKAGVRQEHTEWHTVLVWGKRADGLARILRKGTRIFVEGELRTREYEKGGAKVRVTEVRADEIILCDGGPRDGQTSGQGQRRRGDSQGFAD